MLIFWEYTGGEEGINGLDAADPLAARLLLLRARRAGRGHRAAAGAGALQLGLILRAIRGDEATCQAAGINVTFYKIASLVISAAFAGAGGAMYAHYQLQVSPQLFAVVTSITIITMVYVGGMASIYGAAGGAILLVLLTELLRDFGEWRLMIYSCTLILILFFLPNGLVAPTWRRHAVRGLAAPAMSAASADAAERGHLNKRFGGLHAVKNVAFTVARGEIVGILGPNGAGKTTLYNLLTGFIAPMPAHDRRSTATTCVGRAPHRIAALGISRTFQLCRPFVGLTRAGERRSSARWVGRPGSLWARRTRAGAAGAGRPRRQGGSRRSRCFPTATSAGSKSRGRSRRSRRCCFSTSPSPDWAAARSPTWQR